MSANKVGSNVGNPNVGQTEANPHSPNETKEKANPSN